MVLEETKVKLSEALTGRKLSEEHKKAIGQGNKGKVIKEETRKKLSELNKGKVLLESTKQKMQIASKTRRECCIDGQRFTSIRRASIELGIPKTTISQRLKSSYFTNYQFVEDFE